MLETESDLIGYLASETERLLPQETYDPPYNVEQVRSHYDGDTFNMLYNDPCHRWRMETGIELIHKEPTEEEFRRILSNWKLMDDEMKTASDEKSIELFRVDNMTHAKQLEQYYSRRKRML